MAKTQARQLLVCVDNDDSAHPPTPAVTPLRKNFGERTIWLRRAAGRRPSQFVGKNKPCRIKKSRSRKESPMLNRRNAFFFAAIAFAVCALGLTPGHALESTIRGTGAVTGTVTAGKPFKAAHVYLRGQDKPVTFMVFSANGKYQAINVLPGSYQVSAERRGFSPEPRTIVVKAGETVTADLTMKDGPDVASNVNGPASVTGYPGPGPITGDVEFVSDYDKLYPPGPGRVVLERTCMACHGNNFYGLRQYDHAGWTAVVDMMSKRIDGMDTRVPPGKLTPKDRVVLIDYLAAHFGTDKKKRSLHTVEDIPMD